MDFQQRIRQLRENPHLFDETALDIFQYQASQNIVYQRFIYLLGIDPAEIDSVEKIPFLPVSLYKKHKVITGNWSPNLWFQSSGTTGATTSRHFIQNLDWYHEISSAIFSRFFGSFSPYQFIGLLPNYIENPHSSLIEMVRNLGIQSGSPAIFTGLDVDSLKNALLFAQKTNRKPFIFAVTFALEFLLNSSGLIDFSNAILVETGGMKGLKINMPKEELKLEIKTRLGFDFLYSEYGMSEMLSQAYDLGKNYQPGFSMKVFSRELENPLESSQLSGRGALNIVDLANWSTCAFLATDDLGQVFEDGSFAVLGRVEGSDLRGCNLLFIS